jgi:lysozyme family protein
MDKIFQEAFRKTMEVEGGYVDHPDDPGGKTNFGITELTARNLGHEGKMEDLTLEKAKELYYRNYWKNQKYNKILNRDIAKEMFDQAVNMGPNTANKNLQKAYNLLTLNTITEDGIIGPKTLEAVNNYAKPTALFNLLNGYQIKHYITLAENSDKFKSFIAGWINKRIEIIRK